MGTLEEPMKSELKILFHALCDGLRQEVRQRRSLAHLVPGQDFSITNEREIGITSSLAWHLRLAGFIVQIDAYIADGDPRRRPDFGIWLPASKKYIYLELKITAWGTDWPYSYRGARNDIKKLDEDFKKGNQLNGLIALGFSRPKERQENQLWSGFKKLSEHITSDYSYEEIALECVNLQEMDKRSSYAVIGLWFRKPGKGN